MAYLAAGAAIFLTALCFAEAGSHFESTGGSRLRLAQYLVQMTSDDRIPALFGRGLASSSFELSINRDDFGTRRPAAVQRSSLKTSSNLAAHFIGNNLGRMTNNRSREKVAGIRTSER